MNEPIPTHDPPAPANPDSDRDSSPTAGANSDSDADSSPTDFARTLEEFERGKGASAAAPEVRAEVSAGARVKGTVISVGDENTLVDFGGRSEGVVETRHFRNENGTLRVGVGDVLNLFVVEAGDQILLAPSVRADARTALRQLREAQAAGMPVTGRVTGLNPGGLAVDVSGVRGFCPLSQIESGFCADPSVYVGKTLEFLVTRVEDGRKGAVLSRKQLLQSAEREGAKQMVASLKAGDECEGTIARLEPFGAFVNLGGVDGLLHVSEIRHERTAHPRDALKVGEKVRVRVLKIDVGKDGKPRIGLSMKAIQPDPWIGIETRFVRGARVSGTVARLTDFGAFVTLAPGIDGLVHVSEAAAQRVNHVRDVLAQGQSIEAVVLGVDAEKKRISLSIRATLADVLPEVRPPRREKPVPRDRPAPRQRPARGGAGRRERSDRPPAATVPPARTEEPEMTTMAIALRKAMEHARQKGER